MKKRVSVLALALALIFTISAAAVAPRGVNPIDIVPVTKASSAGVTCSISISAPPGTKLVVSGTVTLYRDDSYLISWPINDVEFEKTYTPVRSGEYRMEYDITVRGPAGTDYLTGSEFDTY